MVPAEADRGALKRLDAKLFAAQLKPIITQRAQPLARGAERNDRGRLVEALEDGPPDVVPERRSIWPAGCEPSWRLGDGKCGARAFVSADVGVPYSDQVAAGFGVEPLLWARVWSCAPYVLLQLGCDLVGGTRTRFPPVQSIAHLQCYPRPERKRLNESGLMEAAWRPFRSRE